MWIGFLHKNIQGEPITGLLVPLWSTERLFADYSRVYPARVMIFLL